jgi:hypothetical protein
MTKLFLSLALISSIICGVEGYLSNETFIECPDYTFQLEEWRIAEVDGSYVIQHLHEEEITHELTWDAGGPDLSDVISLTPTHLIVVYLSGSVGTSAIMDIYRGLIFDTDEMVFVGDFPYKYEHQNGTDEALTQPEWTLKDGKLHIKDVTEGIDTVVDL